MAMKVRLSKGFLSEIDLLRGLFAALVMLGHAIDISMWSSSHDVLYEILIQLRRGLGFVWVVGFVVLSGYCIELSCMKRERFSASRYFAQRLTRIFPLLVVCVSVTGLIEWSMANSPYRPTVWAGKTDFYHFVINLLGAGGFFGQFGSIAPAYTISYELLYYFLWGLSRSLAGERVVTALVMNACFAVGYCMIPAEYIGMFPAALNAIFKQFILLIYVPWLIGAGTAICLERLAADPIVRRIADWGWLLIFFVVLVGGKGFGMPAFVTTSVSMIYYPMLGVCFSLLIIRARTHRTQAAEEKWKRLLGEISYPLFLIHGPTMVLIGFMINSQAIKLPFFVHLALLMAGALTAALVLVMMIERPVMRVRSQYFDRTFARASSDQGGNRKEEFVTS